ncbi:MAG: hypothetical protein JO264_19775 [Acidisphaera sp.]|nr:hypothetical protein [Acidisphaera sp.]
MLWGALATLATPMAILLLFLLWPGVLALVLDRAPGRPVARAMLFCGLAASIAPARRLWSGGMDMQLGLRLLGEPRVLVLAWGACFGGWLLAELVPVLVSLVLERRGAQPPHAPPGRDEGMGANSRSRPPL